MGFAHILLWTPLLAYLPRTAVLEPDVRPVSPHGIWMLGLCVSIAVSVMLDTTAVVDTFRGRCAMQSIRAPATGAVLLTRRK